MRVIFCAGLHIWTGGAQILESMRTTAVTGVNVLTMDDRGVSVTIFVIPEPLADTLSAKYFVHVKQQSSESPSLQYSKFETALFDAAKISPLRVLHLPWPAIERALLSIGAWHGESAAGESELKMLFPEYYR